MVNGLMTVDRSWIPRNAGTSSIGVFDRTTRKDEGIRHNDRKLYFLDQLLSSRTTIRGIILLLQVPP
jgi:hypothetical protein